MSLNYRSCRTSIPERGGANTNKQTKEWIWKIRGERLQEIADGVSTAPRLAAHQPRRSPGEMSVRGPIVA